MVSRAMTKNSKKKQKLIVIKETTRELVPKVTGDCWTTSYPTSALCLR